MTRQLRPRVLVADDYPELVAAISEVLSLSCDVVGHVADGAALLEAVTRLRPDVVVADVHLRGMNGLEACRHITQSPPHAAVVLVSAAADAEMRSLALAAGACAFVSKYAIGDDLAAAVTQAFETTRLDGRDPSASPSPT
jgi:CheY-like chemotaxis protein